ncbi:MAG: 30S ribosomal protein S3 [Lachnospiraceae bacterium]|nr:30S ribosomal protein S3 [Lachnospiraceae bacterium]
MGQKVNPHGLRVGIIKDWESKWYAPADKFADDLNEDYKIRKFLKKKLYAAGISKIEIERASDRLKVTVYTAKPGVVIGKGGAEIEKIKTELSNLVNEGKDKKDREKLSIDIKEIKRPDRDAQLVAENIAEQLENRVSFRRAMKSCMQRTMKAGALGIKTTCAGRLGGADMARIETYNEGTIPLQTLRADIDYGFAEADTTYGKVGVKVWIYKGEVLPQKKRQVKGGSSNVNA